MFALVLATGVAATATAQVDNGTSVEGCIGCHAAGTALPVGNIDQLGDGHYIDTDPLGPRTDSGYRQLKVLLDSVDATGSNAVVDFRVHDENDAAVTNLFASDGRVTIAELVDGAVSGDPNEWQTLVSGERFTSSGGVFQALGGGAYRYTTVFDPTTVPVAAGDTLRTAIQISASDLPAGNGWCDFDADLGATNACPGAVSRTRDIIPTATCNGCHGVTSDTQLSFHGGGRTEVEYCVTCHNPGIGETDMTPLVHKIHYGAELTQGFRSWSHVNFTRDSDNCTSCHQGGGVDENNWATVPNRVACGSCHDDVNFDTGEGHGSGGVQTTNRFCANCHPAAGPWTASQLPVSTVHQGVARATEAGRYRGGSNGYSIDNLSYDAASDRLTIDYSVTRDGVKVDLETDPAFTNGGSLNLKIGWSTDEFSNEGSGSTPAPAQPVSVNARDFAGVVTALGGGDYRAVVDAPSGAFDVVTVTLEGHPAADLQGDGMYVTLPVQSAVAYVSVELRGATTPRRAVVDIAKCNACHDGSGAGLALHGNNRVNDATACALCHNGDATDIARRPADPDDTPDGKREESIDFKRMIHGIHTGNDLANGLVFYGFRGNPIDFSEVDFIGNTRNCLTCHHAGTYSTEDASATLSSTIDTGSDVTDPLDDLNISRISATCSSCHDGVRATQHMVLNGGSFMALDDDISAVPEPAGSALAFAFLAAIGALRRAHRGRREP